MEGSFQNLQALSALLSPTQTDDEEDRKVESTAAHLSPGHIGPPPSKVTGGSSGKRLDNKDIWCEDEVAEGSHYEDLADPRPQPEYDLILKHNMGTEDLFLGLSRKDLSSMGCEAMLVKVHLPGTRASDVVLDVQEKFLDLRTPKYKMGLHLPQPVHSQQGQAQFYSDMEQLHVTLLVQRPLDYLG